MVEEYAKMQPFTHYSDVTHINLYAGSRDTLVPERLTMNSFAPNIIHKNTDHLKNVFHTLDHNSPYYFKPFLDAFVPGVFAAFLQNKDTHGIFKYSEIDSQLDGSQGKKKTSLFDVSPSQTLKRGDRDLFLSPEL